MARAALRTEPGRVERPPAPCARILELAQARRATKEILLDDVVAVRADVHAVLGQPRLRRLDLEFALVDVVEVLAVLGVLVVALGVEPVWPLEFL